MAIAAAPVTSIDDCLVDWRDDHRDLSDAHRAAVGAYIGAILAREPKLVLLGSDAARSRATELWRTFRTSYDGLRGAYGKSNAEDFIRAIARL